MGREVFPLGIYVDRDNPADLAEFKRKGGRFVVARMGDCGPPQLYDGAWTDPSNYVDETFSYYVQEAYDNGLILGGVYRLGTTNDHAVDSITPENCLQLKTVKHAIGTKLPRLSFHFIVISVPAANNTDGNIRDMLDRFYTMVSDTWPSVPVFVATNQAVWEYGSRQIGDLIAQSGDCWPLMVQSDREAPDTVTWDTFPDPAEDHIVETPGFHSHNKFIWEWRWLSGLFGEGSRNLFLRWWDFSGENGLLEYFGTPKYWTVGLEDDPGNEDPGEEPGDDPGEEPGEKPGETPSDDIRDEAIDGWVRIYKIITGK